jgi:hypothetical protein
VGKIKNPNRINKSKGRVCNLCKIYKARDQYYETYNGLNGLQSRCKSCVAGKAQEISKKDYLKKKLLGLCQSCSSPIMPNSTTSCENCWFKSAAYRAGNRLLSEELKIKLQLQDSKCYYTGEQLVPGVNASVDHKTPSTKGGADDLSNLIWVTRLVNSMKGELTQDEFLAICKAVSDNSDIRLLEKEIDYTGLLPRPHLATTLI